MTARSVGPYTKSAKRTDRKFIGEGTSNPVDLYRLATVDILPRCHDNIEV